MTVTFGTDGIRGRAGEGPIVPAVAHAIGRVVATTAPGGVVVVAHDTRPSGPALAEAVSSGVVAVGGTARWVGVAPTVALQAALAGGLGGAGVMVTASHNPSDENGFKVLLAGGRKPDDVAARQLERMLASPPADAAVPGRREEVGDEVRAGFVRALAAAAGDLTPLNGRRIAIDLANGAAIVVRPALDALLTGIEVTWLGTGEGAINDRCGTEHLGHLAEEVRRRGLEGGFAVDGDADRCRIVAGDGAEIPGDAVAWRLARHVHARSLVVTVMSSGALEALLPGVRVVRTQVGDRFVREGMDREGAPLGAEESGHVLFGDHPGGDGLLTGLRTLTAAFAVSGDLAGAFAGFAPLPRIVRSVPVVRRPPLEEVGPLLALEREATARLGPQGRTLLRYSGTESVLRILVEGNDEHEVARAAAALAEAARRELT